MKDKPKLIKISYYLRIQIKIISIFFILIINKLKISDLNNNIINNLNTKYNKFYLNYINRYYNKNIFFNITYINYWFSYKFNIIKVEYKIGFYNSDTLILPSDLTLYYNLHIICHFYEGNNINTESLAIIYNNKYFHCIGYFQLNNYMKLGINILNNSKLGNVITIYLLNHKLVNYNNLNKLNDSIFVPFLKRKSYYSFIKLIEKKAKNYLDLNQYYTSIHNLSLNNNIWNFKYIYNDFYCICKGSNCLKNKISQIYKYYFYLYIIINNKDLYTKTDYLLVDFIFADYSSDDTYPIFQEMIKQKLPAYYLTEKIDIYNEYYKKYKQYQSIILVNRTNYKINGNFLEKYLTIFLRLKAAISGARFYYINNLFYNIDYITYICVGHGVSILKSYLYSPHSYYGCKTYNKILLPPSKIIINIAKKYGWKNENIIKINLPRWDKFKKLFSNPLKKRIINNNSIFIMFTWREIRFNKTISEYYINNIYKLIENLNLHKILNKFKIRLYFTLHHKLNHLINKFKKNKFIHYIFENQISECLSRTQLVVSDFSSIIFDLICREKPYIIFIPDAKDSTIEYNYKAISYNVIESFKNNIFEFKNVFFDVNETVSKIIYYIKNNFKIEKDLKELYKKFNFTSGNNINDFINYLKYLK